MYKAVVIVVLLLIVAITCQATTGRWASKTTGGEISYTTTEATSPIADYNGNYPTIIYLEHLHIKKIGRNSNAKDVVWLLSQGYRVIELDYANNANTITPNINADIIAINDSIAAGSFCGFHNCSNYQSYVLFEGYRIQRNVSYFKDDPTVYNTPVEYTEGDSLHMDIIYPANAAVAVPVVLSFSYSNSYATYDTDRKKLTTAGKDQRLLLKYTLAGFNDSFLEGAPANGIAWAIADHPKYCQWGNGTPVNGQEDTYKSYETNPDAAQKVKSAIRTLRAMSSSLGLSGKIGIFGFSRGATAGSFAIGDRKVERFENAGLHIGVRDDVQAAALGPGVFDYTQIYAASGDGDANLEIHCPWAWGPLEKNYDLWQTMGAAYLVQSAATAPVLFFYNTNDELYYQDQIKHLKTKLDSLGVPTTTIANYGTGHAIPETSESLTKLYQFFKQYLHPPDVGKRR